MKRKDSLVSILHVYTIISNLYAFTEYLYGHFICYNSASHHNFIFRLYS